jgi:undecaprenyl-diphosphatase
MLKWLISLDHKLFFAINSFHSEWVDAIMYWVSNKYTWIPLYALFIYLIITKFKKKAIIILISIILTAILTDQLSDLTKNYFKRLRPSHNPKYENIIHLNKKIKGGKYGFVSSHAANTAGLATYLILLPLLRKKIINLFLVFWVLLVGYSRIYNGLHYPLDVIGGFFLGFFIGIIMIFLTKNVILKKLNLKN